MRNPECGMGFGIQRKRLTSHVSRLTFFLLFTIHCSLFTVPAFAESSIAGGIAKAAESKAEQGKADSGKEESLVQLLEKRNRELDKRENDLNDREARLNQVSLEIDAKIASLSKLRLENESYFKKMDAAEAEKVANLVKIYEAMPQKDAAARIKEFDDETALLVLSSMKQRAVAKILSIIEPDKAAKLSKGLIKTSWETKKH